MLRYGAFFRMFSGAVPNCFTATGSSVRKSVALTASPTVATLFYSKDDGQSMDAVYFAFFHDGTDIAWLAPWPDNLCPTVHAPSSRTGKSSLCLGGRVPGDVALGVIHCAQKRGKTQRS
ncbi:hypothetical protein BH09MYX1_BH09MYX1_59040 [soil metagenome]